MFKLWLGQSLERNPLKKSRDLAQAKALVALVQDKLPHLAKDWHQIRSFPADIAKQAMAKLAG
jgi:Nucleotidyltransferase